MVPWFVYGVGLSIGYPRLLEVGRFSAGIFLGLHNLPPDLSFFGSWGPGDLRAAKHPALFTKATAGVAIESSAITPDLASAPGSEALLKACSRSWVTSNARGPSDIMAPARLNPGREIP